MWKSVGTITQRLLEAGAQNVEGFFLNVSNYQPNDELLDYGTWISDCMAMVTDSVMPSTTTPAPAPVSTILQPKVISARGD